MFLRTLRPECSGRHPSTVNLETRLFLSIAFVVIACGLFSLPTNAATLSLGTIATNGSAASCNDGAGFYYYVYPNTGLALDMTCQQATVNSCSQVINGQTVTVDPYSVTIGYLNPAGVIPGSNPTKGLIILHAGAGGTTPESFALADNYFRAGFEVVQVVWNTGDWQIKSNTTTFVPGNIQAAACRPATVFNWVFNNLFLPSVLGNNPNAGMCALGTSAGSAAVAYSLAYYGAGSYLDNVELLSGPVLSDIEQGCQVPNPQKNQWPVICGLNNGNQYGCALGGGSTWTLSPTYVGGSQNGVANWTNDQSCNNVNGITTMTTQASQQQWLLESLVDQFNVTGLGASPTYNYPSTAMSGWLCRSVKSDPNYNCAANNNANSNSCPNNSSPQGQLFYANITQTNSPPHYALYPVDGCGNAEAVGTGNVPGFYPTAFNGTITGMNAITYDMIGYNNGTTVVPAQCIRRVH